MNVLVVYGSRHGGTRGIAEQITQVLRAEGLMADVAPAGEATEVSTADAFVIGSGVYMGSWLKDAIEFIERNRETLAARPVWLFSSGPLLGSSKSRETTDPITDALGPESGPGSGGRKKIVELGAAIHARDHRVFRGAFDPNDPPRAMSERLVRMMPGSGKILPPGDFRDWDEIDAWARGIAAALASPMVIA